MTQVVSRLRSWLQKQRLPIEIQEVNGSYHITGSQSLFLKIHSEVTPQSREDLLLKQLKELAAMKSGTFSANEVSESLKIPLWTARRLLNVAREKNVVQVHGQGPAGDIPWLNPSKALKVIWAYGNSIYPYLVFTSMI